MAKSTCIIKQLSGDPAACNRRKRYSSPGLFAVVRMFIIATTLWGLTFGNTALAAIVNEPMTGRQQQVLHNSHIFVAGR
jgi:hypothetical protein